MIKHFERALGEFDPDGELSQMDRIRELAGQCRVAMNARREDHGAMMTDPVDAIAALQQARQISLILSKRARALPQR